MAPHKDREKVPEIPYSGALKKLFEQVEDVDFSFDESDVNVGKRYYIQRKIASPRLWYLELHKLPRDGGFAFRVAVNGVLPPETNPAFATISNLIVTHVKVNRSHIFVWVENASGSVANLIFNEDEDKFQARLFTEGLVVHGETIKEMIDSPLLSIEDIRDLNGSAESITRVLKHILVALHEVNKLCLIRASEASGNRRTKKTIVPTVVIPTAPSRDRGIKKTRKVPKSIEVVDGKIKEGMVRGGGARKNIGTVIGREADNVNNVIANESATSAPADSRDRRISSSQIQTSLLKLRGKKKTTNSTQERQQQEDIMKPQSPDTKRRLDIEFQGASGSELVPAPLKRKLKERIHQHPVKTLEGKRIDFQDFQDELIQFKERSKPMYIWGQDTFHMVSVDAMEIAPNELKYRPFHESLLRTLTQIFLTALHPQKQTLTLMPACKVKPKSFEDCKDGPFYIINGQHTFAAAKTIISNPDVHEEQKEKLRYWNCDFVWTEDLVLLSELSRRTNNTNQHVWNSPEYLLHIQYCRDLWINYDRPEMRPGVKVNSTEHKNWKEFQLKAVETLNSMNVKNQGKTSKEYQGEFKVICADDELYMKIMNAFKWYESGDLLNPDTGSKWRHESEAFDNKEWTPKHTVAYTFKCIRSLGRDSLLELVEKIINGLDENGNRIEDGLKYPKVMLGGSKPKKRYTCTLKEWTDRKKAKNAIVRWLDRKYPRELWNGDLNTEEWKAFKEQLGFTSAHMDELIRRATKQYLAKFMKVSDKPKRQQPPPPNAFLAEMQRILQRRTPTVIFFAPVISVLQRNGTISEFARARTDGDSTDLPGPVDDPTKWVTVPPRDFSFAGGIMDFRQIDSFLEEEDTELPQPAMNYISLMSNLAVPPNILMAPPYWMIIAHSNQFKEVELFIKHYFQDWIVSESRYVPAAGEKHFFSNFILKKGNGVLVSVLQNPKYPSMDWGKQVVCEEREKKIGEVREFHILEHELRMEVYLNFILKIKLLLGPLTPHGDILCVAAGRKPMIASVMCQMRPVAVIVAGGGDPTDYLRSHTIGCYLQGFNHLFDPSLRTEDTIDPEETSLEDTDPLSQSDNDTRLQEIRSKKRADKSIFEDEEVHDLNEFSNDTSGECNEESNVEVESDDDAIPLLKKLKKAPVPSNAPIDPIIAPIRPQMTMGYQRHSRAVATHEIDSNEGFEICGESPAGQLFKKSSFAACSSGIEHMLLTEPLGSDKGTQASSPFHDNLVESTIFETPSPFNILPHDFDVVENPITVSTGMDIIGKHVGSEQFPQEEDIDANVEVTPCVAHVHEKLVVTQPDLTVTSGDDQILAHGRNVPLAMLENRVVKSEPLDDILTPIPLKSNEDDPILIESDEDDHIVTTAWKMYPSESDSELSDEADNSVDKVMTDAKVSQDKALRIQLQKISKSKLSVNKTNRQKNRELVMKNLRLMQELTKAREKYQKLMSSGLFIEAPITSDNPSISAGPSHQATTSIASAPELSVSECDPHHQADTNLVGRAREDYIPATQESVLKKQREANIKEGMPPNESKEI